MWRHKVATLMIGMVIWWLWPDSDRAHSSPPAQAAVMFGGFVAIDGNRVVELEHDGEVRDDLKLASVPSGARVMGASDRALLGWRDGKQMAFAFIQNDGALGKPAKFGKRVRRVCEGLATNDHQFGLAWTESDGRVWFVHGPTYAPLALDHDLEAAIAADDGPCWIASAGESLALMWREKRRTMLAVCGKKCELAQRAALPADATPVGVGCANNHCVVASRSSAGGLQATWIDTSRRTHAARWTKPLPSGTRDGRIAITGTGSQVAIAYPTGGAPVVVIANAAGTISAIWQHAADDVPSIVWSLGRLLVAHHVGGVLRTDSIAVP
ncbi:MAG: hypothetical protein AB7L28_25000 [Kofleriaceae bacterium]